MLYESDSMTQKFEFPITVNQLLTEVLQTFKREDNHSLRSNIEKFASEIEIISVHEITCANQACLLVALNNCVRVTLCVASKPVLDFASDVRVLKLESSPFERAFDMMFDSNESPLLTIPASTASLQPFKYDFAVECVLKQYACFEDTHD
jgi:hypothetical protein